MESSYWLSVLAKRNATRRRFLAGSAALAFGGVALSLAGCGSGDDEPNTVEGDASGLLTQREETTAQANVGGAWPSSYAEDVVNMDPILNNASPTFPQLIPVYSQLLKAGISLSKKPGVEATEGDAAASWEITPDGRQITLKLREGMKWDARPPTNGRFLNSADVSWSWQKFEEFGNSAAELVHSVNPDAPVESLETPDSQTVVMKMAFPYPNVIEQLSNQQNFYVMPQDDSFDFGKDMRGSGPYILDEFLPSQHAFYVRNPDWYDSPRPYFERLERTLIPEYASILGQFKAGNIWDFELIRPEDVLPTKQEHPPLVMYANPEIPATLNGFMNFSKRPDGLFNDVRLRRALSTMLDRDLLVEVFENVKEFRDAGLPVEIYWCSHLAPGLPEWLDPKGTGLGEGAGYFQHDPAEARKLVEAAGVDVPYEAPFGHYIDQVPEDQKRFEVLIQMMNEGGTFAIKSDPLLYNTSWRSARQAGGMEHLGLLWHRTADLSADVILTQMWTPQGRNSADTRGPTPGVTDLVLKQKGVSDPEERTEIIHEIQRTLALEWPVIPWAGASQSFTLHWPWLVNYNIFIEGNPSAKSFVYAWYNEKEHKAG